MVSSFEQFQFLDEEGRQAIYKWSQSRQKKYKGFGRFVYLMKIFAFDKSLLKSFIHNVNVIVLVQMFLAGIITYLCSYANLFFEVHVTLFVSPLVFPLAFSINTDFQRREKVLEDLANFKASTMVWFFCVRDWRIPARSDHQGSVWAFFDAIIGTIMFDEAFMKAVSSKTKGLMFHLREYLLTEKSHQRDFILRVLYEDLSDLAQINEKIRTSKLESTSPIAARVIHLHYLICLSFERLRVIREYRSPRSIRSFTKIFIFALPLLLAPYYVYLGRRVNNTWSPYVIAVLVTFLFGALQGVQDKLDDPFDGMSEDDINLGTLDEWTAQSLEATANRTIRVGRFTVSVSNQGNVEFSAAHPAPGFVKREESFGVNRAHARKRLGLLPWQRQLSQLYSEEEASPDAEELEGMHPYKEMLAKLPGNATIVRGGHVKERMNLDDLLQGTSVQSTVNPVFDKGFFQTPTSSVQRTTEPQKSVGFHPSYEAPKSFRGLFFPTEEPAAIKRQPVRRQSSLPTFAAFEAFQNKYNGSVPLQMNYPQERQEAVAYPGIGAASYINSMNKERRRKISAPLLCPPYELGGEGEIARAGSICSNDSVGIVMNENEREAMSPQNVASIFHLQKATPVNLNAISPTINDENIDLQTVLLNRGTEEKPSKNRKLRKAKGFDGEIDLEENKQKICDRNVVIDIKSSSSKTNLINENGDSHDEKESLDSVVVKEPRKAPRKRFAVKKTGSDSRLIGGSPDSGSEDSLSRAVGKWKDKEVFF